MQAELGVTPDAGAPAKPADPKPEPKPKADKPKDDAKPKDDEIGEGSTVDLDPFEDEAPEPEAEPEGEPDKANLTKKVEQQGYAIANLTKNLERLTAALEANARNSTPAKQDKVDEIQEQVEDQVEKLVDAGLLDPELAKWARDLQNKAKPDKELKRQVAELQATVSRQKQERDFDRTYPELAGNYDKALAKAWEAADKRFPSATDETKSTYVAGKIHDIAEAAVARIKKNKAASTVPPAEPSARPDTSTKGARVAQQGAARPNQVEPVQLSEAESARKWEQELRESLGV